MNFRSKFEKRQNKNAARKQAVQFPPAKKTRSEKKRAAVRPEPVWQEPVWSRHRLMHQLLQNALNSLIQEEINGRKKTQTLFYIFETFLTFLQSLTKKVFI